MEEVVAYDPEKRKRYYQQNKAASIEYSTWYNRLRKLGITKQEYTAILEKQNGVCAICSNVCSKSLAVDHDHATGVIRGLLCNKCNRGIGYLQDSPEILQKALNYLKGSLCGS